MHTVLSPCAEVEMIPPLIVRRAKELALDLIAVTDHNSAENVGAVMAAANGQGLSVMPGEGDETKARSRGQSPEGATGPLDGWQCGSPCPASR